MNKPNIPISYSHYQSNEIHTKNGEVIVETPVALSVNNDVWLTFMCTPIDLEALAIGFLYNERVIDSYDEVASVRVCTAGDNVDVWLTHGVDKPEKWVRTSGCTGGITSIQTTESQDPVINGGVLHPKDVGQLINSLFASQTLYRSSGGVHTSAISDGKQLFVVAEDIGRHNTLDKLAGLYLKENIDLPRNVILTTGRISSEMLQKSARLEASILISRTSPSSLSIEMAQRLGITLIGYARRNSFNIYSHPQRILHFQEGAQTR
jgi:FdhD protein